MSAVNADDTLVDAYLRALAFHYRLVEAELAATTFDEAIDEGADESGVGRETIRAMAEGADWWACESIEEAVAHEPVRAWGLLLAVIAREPNDAVLQAIAAGPLEDLMNEQDNEFFEHVVEEAKRNRRLARALSGTWIDSPAIRERIAPLLVPPFLPAYESGNWPNQAESISPRIAVAPNVRRRRRG